MSSNKDILSCTLAVIVPVVVVSICVFLLANPRFFVLCLFFLWEKIGDIWGKLISFLLYPMRTLKKKNYIVFSANKDFARKMELYQPVNSTQRLIFSKRLNTVFSYDRNSMAWIELQTKALADSNENFIRVNNEIIQIRSIEPSSSYLFWVKIDNMNFTEFRLTELGLAK